MINIHDNNKQIDGRWVSDTLKYDIPQWENKDFVIVSSPTGSGKNTFIRDCLIPYAKRKNQDILILSNRVALSLQQKKMLHEIDNKNMISTNELEKRTRFGNVLVFSYHSILSELHNRWNQFSNVRYVILDECHFFVSDARFNSQTGNILWSIIDVFSDFATRIYLTATPQKVIDSIKNYEEQAYKPKFGYNRVIASQSYTVDVTCFNYEKVANYDDYNFKFFDSWQLIANEILNSPKDEKWLIFVRKKSDYENIKTLLDNIIPSNKIDYINASDKTSSVYSTIIRDERFNGKILVSTSVMDNGVNFSDGQLKNIVVDSLDSITTIQMVGRKRRSNHEAVNIYLRVPEKEEVNDALMQVKGLLSNIDEYKMNPNGFMDRHWGDLDPSIQKMFTLIALPQNQYLHFPQYRTIVLNGLAETKLWFDLDDLEEIKEQFEKEIPYGFQKIVLKWFDKSEADFVESMQMELNVEKYRDDLIQLIESHIDEKILENNKEEFVLEFFQLYWKVSGKMFKYNALFKANINKALEALNLPYIFKKITVSKTKTSDKYEYWFFEYKDAVSSSKQAEKTSAEITEQTDEKQKSETVDAPILSPTETPKKNRGRPKKVSNS